MRSTWNIAFGDYDLRVDRRALTFTLTETNTGTVWGTEVSLGWMDVQERATGTITRHDFGTLRQLTVSEKAGPQGKRILWGLDLDGIPVDLYLICSQREIQLVLEANRDNRTHQVVGFGLVPGLCGVPDDGASYLVVPQGDGALYAAPDVPEDHLLPIWNAYAGVTMPFVGAVRNASLFGPPAPSSALVCLTDSAYGGIRLSRADSQGTASMEYRRDPERRRLDLRLILLPHGDYVSIARTYREKLINDSNHVTLRRKMRDTPLLAQLLQGDTALIPLRDNHNGAATLQPGKMESAWEYQEQYLQAAEDAAKAHPDTLFGDGGACDWANLVLMWSGASAQVGPPALAAPLYPVVYHDALLRLARVDMGTTPLQFLLHLGFGTSALVTAGQSVFPVQEEPLRSVFFTLPRLAFGAFLTAHRFLTPDRLVEEANYSDKTRVVINQSETDSYDSNDLTLPPLGFYVRHPQMEAHDAFQVGTATYAERRWRIAQARDGKPLEQSGDVLRREFPVPTFANETDRGENPLQ